VLPFNPGAYRDRAGLRRRLGYPEDQPLLVAAVGGTAVGVSLLELTCDAFARLRKQVPDARMLLVTGPRIHPRLLPDIEAWTNAVMFPICSSIWRVPTQPSCRAGCRRRWNWWPTGRAAIRIATLLAEQ
jgi:hypothetical protein